MSKTINIGNKVIVSVEESETSLSLSENDIQMDIRAKEAVKSALNRAKICGKPVAKYDIKEKKVYIENADGVKEYVWQKTYDTCVSRS